MKQITSLLLSGLFALCVNLLYAQPSYVEGVLMSTDSLPQAGFKVQYFAQQYLIGESKTDSRGRFSIPISPIRATQISVHKMGIREAFAINSHYWPDSGGQDFFMPLDQESLQFHFYRLSRNQKLEHDEQGKPEFTAENPDRAGTTVYQYRATDS
ncbi:MAG: hypothetical protein AAGM67_21875, partial [Bacteroidota bacterium]